MNIRNLFLLGSVLLSAVSFSQQKPYNKEFKFEIIKNTEVLSASDSIRALIVNFENDDVVNFSQTLNNNPQIREVKLFDAPQAAIDNLSQILAGSLTHLIIEDYTESSIIIPSFPTLELISINSDFVESIDMTESTFDNLFILAIDSESLVNWKSQSHFKELGLIDLEAPKLEHFPIESAPELGQFSFHCSLDDIPSFLCECEDLELMSFGNFKNIKVDECLKGKIYDGFYSNLTIKDGVDGPVVLEWLSKDRLDD